MKAAQVSLDEISARQYHYRESYLSTVVNQIAHLKPCFQVDLLQLRPTIHIPSILRNNGVLA